MCLIVYYCHENHLFHPHLGAPPKWDKIVPAAIINNYRVNDQISFKIPLEFMKKKAAATTAAVPFHWCR